MRGKTGTPTSIVPDPEAQARREKHDKLPARTKAAVVARDSRRKSRFTPEYQEWLDRQKAKRR